MLAKKYIGLKFNIVDPAVAGVAQKYGCGNYSVVLLNPTGDVVAKFTNHPTPAQIGDAIIGIPEVTAGREQLGQLKAKGITKANAESVAAALKKIGTVPSDAARETILVYAKDDSAPEGVQRGAILALSKQPAAAGDLVPYLTDKRYPIKSAAQTTLQAMGLPAVPALLDGLASDDADVRTACFGPASAVTKNGKVAKDLTFWKSGKADDRSKAISEWKSWVDGQLHPKPKDPPAPKK